MPIVYKKDILAALKEAGYNTSRLRKEKLLSEGVIQSLRENKYIALQNISKICELLNCQPGDLLEYVPEKCGDVFVDRGCHTGNQRAASQFRLNEGHSLTKGFFCSQNGRQAHIR